MIKGFSKLSRLEKIAHLTLSKESEVLLVNAMTQSTEIASVIDELSENTISHYSLPIGIAPNVIINKKEYLLPLVTEESSVVAAISKATKFWSQFGGFTSKVSGTEKRGQVHFFWKGDAQLLKRKFVNIKEFILLRVAPLTRKMNKRGGGIIDISLVNKTQILDNYFQIDVYFETAEAMGANFINSCLEEMSKALIQFVVCDQKMNTDLLEINMAILSNYTPKSKVIAEASCSTESIDSYGENLGINHLSEKMLNAYKIADIDVNRAVTHNKGIYNGVDALVLATGNDWRSVEACGHAYASRNGQYSALSKAYTENGKFHIQLEIPLAIGTIGGVTQLHPIAKIAMQIMGNPNTKELMQLVAVCGLAANFSSVLALTTYGIQKGHMKMHLTNLLKQLNAKSEQIVSAKIFFKDKTVSYSEVEKWLLQNK